MKVRDEVEMRDELRRIRTLAGRAKAQGRTAADRVVHALMVAESALMFCLGEPDNGFELMTEAIGRDLAGPHAEGGAE